MSPAITKPALPVPRAGSFIGARAVVAELGIFEEQAVDALQ